MQPPSTGPSSMFGSEDLRSSYPRAWVLAIYQPAAGGLLEAAYGCMYGQQSCRALPRGADPREAAERAAEGFWWRRRWGSCTV